MVSTRTENRARKIDILKSCQTKIIDLMLLEHKDREKINMSRFKELAYLLDNMVKEAER